jgi:hypothetical protein
MLTLYESTYYFMIYMLKYIIFFPLIIFILTFIFAGIYAGIYNLNYLRTLREIFLFYIIFIYSIFVIFYKIMLIPGHIITIIINIFFKIGYIFNFIFTSLAYMNSFLYDMTNVEI